jgi:hypothetical protein
MRLSLRRLCARRHEEAAKDARAQAEHSRSVRVSGGDEEQRAYWAGVYATSAREAEARAVVADAVAAWWLA